MKKTFIFLLTLSVCLAKTKFCLPTHTITATIRDHITHGLEKLQNITPPVNFPSPFNSSLCKPNFTCNNASQFVEELIEYLDQIKVDESHHNATRILKILMGNLKQVKHDFQNGYTMKGENKSPCRLCCRGSPSLKFYRHYLHYLNRKCCVEKS